MYNWLVFLHVLGVLGFMLGHGVTFGVTVVLGRQKDPEKMRLLLGMARSRLVYGFVYVSLLLLLITGIWAGISGDWWSMWWIRLSLILLVVIGLVMGAIGRGYLDRVAVALDGNDKTAPVGQAELEAIASRPPAMILTVVGLGGIAIILWLMMFKPF